MAETTVHARYVFVGRPAPDRVPADRLSFYQWLAPVLISRSRCRVQAKDVYVAADEMKTNPGIIRRLLENDLPTAGGQSSVILIDLAVNAYHVIRDNFLFHVMDAAQRWLASRPRQTIIILLPGAGLPATASIFWDPTRDADAKYSKRLSVIANDGSAWPDWAEHLIDRAVYVRRQRNRPANFLTEALRVRVICKPGHYDIGSPQDPHCARYFFETEQAEHEIGELVVNWVEHTLQPALPPGESLTLASQAKWSKSFHDAVAGAATSLGCLFVKLDDDGMAVNSTLPSKWVAPVFHTVNSGSTFRRVISQLTAAGARMTPEALAVMTTGAELSVTQDGVRLRTLCGPYNRERVKRAECPQCRLGLPHTPAESEAQIGVRAFDMWNVLLEADWHREQFGAPPRQRYTRLPDMGQVFSRHGNWIAYKVQYLLKTLGADGEVAFICPEEANVEELVLHLGILLQNRQVTVRVPPAVIRGANWRKEVDLRVGEDWHRQLSYLGNKRFPISHLGSQRFPSVVIIDEIAGRKTTADGLVRLLRSFGVEPFAYVPVIDFSPDRPLHDVPTYPLYRIPNPRADH